MREERERQINHWGKAKTNTAIPLSSDKGKHAERPKCGLPQINILPLFVWEKRPPSPWELHLSQELEAHAVLRRRPRHSWHSLDRARECQRRHPQSGITTSCTCSASETPGVTKRVIDPTLGQTNCDRNTPPTTTFTYLRNEWKSSNTASHPGHLHTPWP